MIKCKSVSKAFGTHVVIDEFSYEFMDTGFYLLYGESGSGKTTFLNILCGFICFEEGSICIEGKEYTYCVEADDISHRTDYIIQDSIYVDFLTVAENLSLVCEDLKKVESVLERFGLNGKEKQYPSTLSGGEKQRLAIARAVLGQKKILFLDEPTASLDEKNKIEVFEYLKMVKEDMLIICSSHDYVAKEYADETILFEKSYKQCEKKNSVNKEKIKKSKCFVKKECKKNYHFINKWFKSERHNSKSNILFGIFLTLAICICTLADIPNKKYESNLEYMFKINHCEFSTTNENGSQYEELCKTEGIIDVVLPYGNCIPDTPIDPNASIQTGPHCDIDLSTLPYNKEAFRLSDRMLYGTYFTDEFQVVLLYETAIEMNRDNPESLIGTKITKNVYNYGNTEFEIVGIFDKFTEVEDKYFKAINIDSQGGVFVNNRFTERYIKEGITLDKKYKRYVLYFDTYKDMKNFCNSDTNRINAEDVCIYEPYLPKTKDVFITLFNVTLPLSVFVCIFTVLFYTNLIKTEIAYNNIFISVFEYSGYNKKKVINYFIRMNFMYLLRICLIAVPSALMITYILNIINIKFEIIGFQIFTYNIQILSLFIIGIILVSFIVINVLLRRVRLSSWYENVIAQRDLL